MVEKIKKTKRGVETYFYEELNLEILKTEKIVHILEDADYYYVRPYTDDNYDNTWYVIDKNTKEIRWTYYMDLFLILDSLSPVSLERFKKAVLL